MIRIRSLWKYPLCRKLHIKDIGRMGIWNDTHLQWK